MPTIPGADQALQLAGQRGWEAVVLVIVLLGLIGLTGFIVRWLIASMDKRMQESRDREVGMAIRLRELENFVQVTLLKLIKDNSVMTTTVLDAVLALTGALDKRPCILDVERQEEVVDRLASGLAQRGLAWPTSQRDKP